MADKPHINIMTAGHVDAGKSTLSGRLLYDTGAIQEPEMRKLKDIAVYALLTLIMVKEAQQVRKEIAEFPYIVMANAPGDQFIADSDPGFPLLDEEPCPCKSCIAAVAERKEWLRGGER